MCDSPSPLPQILPPQTPVDEVPPFTLLVLPGLQDREGRMTLVEGVFFFHRSSTPIARETFLSFPSNVFVPSLTSLLSLSVFCSCELVRSFLLSAFSSTSCVLLLPFLLSEPSTQERSSSLLTRGEVVPCACAFLPLLHISFFLSCHKPFPPPIGPQPVGEGA